MARLWGLWSLHACRIVEVVDEADRRGFAYGTLPAHGETGEECFLVERLADGSVAMSSTLAGEYIPLSDAAESSLRQVVAANGRSDTDIDPILSCLRRLEPYPDAADALRELSKDHRLVVLTNSSREMAEELLTNSGLSEYIAHVRSADEFGHCKPHPVPYRETLAALDVKPEQACFVAAHGWDIVGANAVGLRTVWVSRLERHWPFPGQLPDREVATLNELPEIVHKTNRI
eukprot:g5290.t1